jgi:hypothetical protein
LSFSIKDLDRPEDQSPPTTVQSEKVTRFLKLRYKLRKRKEKTAGKLEELKTKLDPRATQEDYLRRRQRLMELIEQTREDTALGHDGELAKSLLLAEGSIESADLAVSTAQSKNQRPDYGAQRDVLKDASDRLQLAITTATKRVDKLDRDNPAISSQLSNIEEMLDDASTKASADQLTAWRNQLGIISAVFYGAKPDLKKVTTAVGGLANQMSQVLVANAKRAEAIRLKTAQLTAKMTASSLPTDGLAPIDALLKRAGRESTALDFDSADSTLQDAENRLPQGKPVALPSMNDIALRRKDLHRRALASIPPIKDGQKPPQGAIASKPGRERVVALLHRLDELRPLCEQQTEGVAGEALRRLQACEEEFKRIGDQESSVSGYMRDRQSLGDFIDSKITFLAGEFAKQKPDGGLIALKLRLQALQKNFANDWSKLMTQKEIEDSGLLREATQLDEDFDDWKGRRDDQPQLTKGWQQDFYAAVEALRDATQQAREKDVGLLQLLGLATKMPALVAQGGKLISANAPNAEKAVRPITLQLLDVVRQVADHFQQAEDDPGAFETLVKQGEKLADAYNLRIDKQVEALQELQPGKKMAKAKNVVKFFKESAFSDDDEREVRITYGATLKDTLEGMVALLYCKDATAVPAALEDIKAFESKVKDYEAMGASGGKPGEKTGAAPPTFAELEKRIKEIQKRIAENTKDDDLGTRVDTLKGWSDQASDLTEEIGDTDPREMERRIGVLEREIVETTRKDKVEIANAKVQRDALVKLLMRIMDARKKGSPLLKDFAPLLAQMQRQGEAMRKATDQWKITDAGFDTFKTEVEKLLNSKRTQEDTTALEKKSAVASKEDRDVEAARKALLKLRDADLKLWRERIEKYDDKEQKKTLLKLLDDLDKEAERGLDSLAENRDGDGAQSLVQSVLREISDAASGQGDKIASRGDLEKVDTGWRNAVASLGKALIELDKAVTAAANGAANDVVAAAKLLRKNAIDPVMSIFDPAVFTGSMKGLASDNSGVRASNREAALLEVRRLRRIMETDNRVRMLTLDNPFGVTVPFTEISSRLFDVEVNVTRARGG